MKVFSSFEEYTEYRENTLKNMDKCNKTGVLLPGFKDFGVQVAAYDSLKKSHKDLLKLEDEIQQQAQKTS
jgi:hypothetical protein